MSTRIAMLLDHNGAYDSRVIRETRTLQAAGYDVRVFCKTDSPAPQGSRPQDVTYTDCPFEHHNTALRLLGIGRKKTVTSTIMEASSAKPAEHPKPTSNVIKRILGTALSFRNNLMTVSDAVLTYRPDILHAHDLSMLPAGVRLAKKLNAPLIYDSHEYEYDRNIIENSLQRAIRRFVESRNIKKSDAVITVSDSIADALKRRHHIDRPHIVLNSNNFVKPQKQRITRSSLDLPAGPMGVYFGGIQKGRGIDAAIQALTHITDSLCIIGHANTQQTTFVMEQAADLGVADKVYLRPPLSPEELLWLGDVFDYSIIPIQKTCASYDFALPNKLFQSAGAGLPLVVTPLKEIRQFTEHFDLGCVAKGFTGLDLAEAIKSLSKHSKKSVSTSDLEPYSWKASQAILLSIYKGLLSGKAMPLSQTLPHSRGS